MACSARRWLAGRGRFAGRVSAALLGALAAVIVPLPTVTPAMAEQPRWGQWWFDEWRIEKSVWPVTRGAGVTVAVLDSGVDGGVQTLKGAVLPGTATQVRTNDTGSKSTYAFPDGNEVVHTGRGDGSGKNNNQHGTHMAQLIAGRGLVGELSPRGGGDAGRGLVGAGVAPQAKILPVDLTIGDGVSTGFSFNYAIPAGIRWAVDQGAKVISLSVGDDYLAGNACPAYYQKAIAYAIEHDVVVVAAAGNAGDKDNGSMAPANCPGVLAVGAVDRDGQAPDWSQRQPYVSVAAPGVDIPVVDRNWFNGTRGQQTRGTSNATALVSGVVALVRSEYPKMPARQVVQRIINTTDKAAADAPKEAVGAGIVNVRKALDVQGRPVRDDAPNPVYAGFDAWLASPEGQQIAGSDPWPGEYVDTSDDQSCTDPLTRCYWDTGRVVLLTGGIGLVLVFTITVVALLAMRRRRRYLA